MNFKNRLNSIFQKITGYKLIHRDLDIHIQLLFDEKYGHRKSREAQQSIDELGNPVPWITYPAFEYLNQFDLCDKDIFEYGSGNSSLYFADRCHKIISVETDKVWFDAMKKKSKKNMNIVFKDPVEAAHSINDFDTKFDLIFIDSASNRYECAKAAYSKLKSGGIIILDNSDRYLKAAKFLNSKEYIQVDMHGLGPINKYTFSTSFFFDRNFKWSIRGIRQPEYSKGAIIESAL